MQWPNCLIILNKIDSFGTIEEKFLSMVVIMQKKLSVKYFFALFLFNGILVFSSMSIFTKEQKHGEKKQVIAKKAVKKKSWSSWLNEPVYVGVPVLESLHEGICKILEIDDLYTRVRSIPDDTYKAVSVMADQSLSVQKQIKIFGDPLAKQLVDPLLELFKKGYWVRKTAKEVITASWKTESWAKVVVLYGCDFACITIAYPNDNAMWCLVKSLLLSDWYNKLYQDVVPIYVQKKKWLNFVVNAYALELSNYCLGALKFYRISY